jgi:hypothetical protein
MTKSIPACSATSLMMGGFYPKIPIQGQQGPYREEGIWTLGDADVLSVL